MLNGNPEIAMLLERAGAVLQPLTPVDELRAACMRADRPAVQRLVARDPTLADQLTDTWPDLV